ncbi:MAG TPA: septum formation initiator family protein [Terriglobales bacterium]|nr:septum formation initiator family protein [Terriglobales bacterium]
MDFRVRVPRIRVLPPAEARLRSLTQGAEQAEAWAAKVQARIEPFLQTVFALRRRLATAAVAILAVWLFLHVTFGANGMVVYRAKRAEYRRLQQEIEGLQRENQKYADEIIQLKNDPKRIEKEAREQFHYARPGEVVYVTPGAPPTQAPANRTASK